jgi:L,D-transpeptidase ErfK/SrfK
MSSRLLFVVLSVLLLCAVPVRAQALRPIVGEDVIHEVGPGENLYTLAHDHHLGLEHITYANKLPMQLEIPQGTIVTLPTRRILPSHPPADGMVLNIPERGIYLFRHGQFVDFFPVAVGRLGFLTPRGNFHIIEKIKNPTWYPPSWADVHKPIGPGKDNPLGDRWMGTSATRVGIHGTCSPYSIGMCISHGCIRCYPDQVRELFEQVRVGMPIRIEYETAKVGIDPGSGNVYLATFPDVYHLQDPVAEAIRKVRAAGLLGKIPVERIRALASASFRAMALVGSDFVARLDDREVPLRVAPLVRGETLWLPAEFLRQMGMTVVADEDRLTVDRGADQMLLDLRRASPPAIEPADPRGRVVTDASGRPVQEIVVEDGKPVSTAYLWKGHAYVRADDLFDYFGYKYDWKIARQMLSISTPHPSVQGVAP